MATVYSDRGFGVRAPTVFYNRCNEAAAQLKPGDFDWDDIFGAGVRWFHSGGIFASLSETTAELIIEAHGGGARRTAPSCRSISTTARSCGAPPAAPTARSTVLGRIVEHVDVLVGNEEDLQKGLGIAGPEVAAKLEARSQRLLRHDRARRQRFPAASRSWRRRCARCTRPTGTRGARSPGSTADPRRPTCELDVYDRVGGGDGFASGLFYGLLTGESPEKPSSSAGRTARCSRPSPATRRWRLRSRCARSRRAGRRGYSGRSTSR